MPKIDSPFDVLGIKADATDAEVKAAYRELVKLHHPDKGGDDAKFRQIQSAYNKAKNPKWRKQYAAIAQVSQNSQRDDDLYSKILNSLGNNPLTTMGRNMGKTAMYQQFANAYGVPVSALQGNSSGIGSQPSYSYSTQISLAKPKQFIIPPHSARNIQAMQNRVGLGGTYNTYQMTFEYLVDQNREVPLAGDEVINIADILSGYMPMYAGYAQQQFTSSRAIVTESRTSISRGACTCSLTIEWS